jgi:hypothetical protein
MSAAVSVRSPTSAGARSDNASMLPHQRKRVLHGALHDRLVPIEIDARCEHVGAQSVERKVLVVGIAALTMDARARRPVAYDLAAR